MNFNKFTKISVKVIGGIFLSLIFFVSLFPPEADAPLAQIFIRPALAQDAIQCTPDDINLNRNLKFVDNDNIYLGTGKLNFSGGNADIYATNSSGNLLFRNSAAKVITQSNTILFQNATLNPSDIDLLAGIYDSNAGIPPPMRVPSRGRFIGTGHYFVVNGVLEAQKISAATSAPSSGELCLNGPCITSWRNVNTDAYGERDTQDLSISPDGTVLSLTDGGSVTLSGTSSSSGGVTEIKDDDGPGGISVVNGLGPIVSLSAVGGTAGVSKITVGSGLTIASLPDATGNPTSGSGDVTIKTSSPSPCAAGFIRSGNMCLAGGLNGNRNLDILAIREIYDTDSDDIRSPTNDQADFAAAAHPDFAALDISALNGTNAKFAMIRAMCVEAYIYVRKAGSTIPARYATYLGDDAQQTLLCAASDNAYDWSDFNNIFYIELNSNKDIEWSVAATDPDTVGAGLYLVGYID